MPANLRFSAVILFGLSSFAVIGQSPAGSADKVKRYSGKVSAKLPGFEFVTAEVSGGEVDGDGVVKSVEVRSQGRHVQTIRFPDDDDAPIDYAHGPIVTLEDVNCDGYKDLLVRKLVGVHGDAWYFLYLYDSASGKFVEYKPFSQLAYTEVSCKTRVVRTYVNEGGAGCAYEAGWYRWIKGDLVPVRIESQDGNGVGRWSRTISVRRNGKLVVQSEREMPIDDCHQP